MGMDQVATDGLGADALNVTKQNVKMITLQLPVVEARMVSLSNSARKRVEQADQERLCVACMKPLGAERGIRGCHGSCHHATLRAIETGKWTENQRVTAGKLLPKGRPGPKPSNPVTIEAMSLDD